MQGVVGKGLGRAAGVVRSGGPEGSPTSDGVRLSPSRGRLLVAVS
jgi:hypothetical protein